MHDICFSKELLDRLGDGEIVIDRGETIIRISFKERVSESTEEEIDYEEHIVEEVDPKAFTNSHLEVRLGKGFENPQTDSEDLLAIQESAASYKGEPRIVVVGDISGEICHAISTGCKSSLIYRVGLDMESVAFDNVKIVEKDPIRWAKQLTYQGIDALYVLANVNNFRDVLVSWAKHLGNNGVLYIIEPAEVTYTEDLFDRNAFAALSDNVYFRTFAVDQSKQSEYGDRIL